MANWTLPSLPDVQFTNDALGIYPVNPADWKKLGIPAATVDSLISRGLSAQEIARGLTNSFYAPGSWEPTSLLTSLMMSDPGSLQPWQREYMDANSRIAATENYDTGFGAGKWVPGAILGLGGLGIASELGAGNWFGDLFGGDAPWGVNAAKEATGAGMDLPLVDDWSNWMTGGNMMPAAIPESPAQLAEWGLTETSPGFWEQPAIPGSLGSATDWITKIASSPSTWANVLGKLGATALGAVGANQQAKSLQELAQKYSDYGAPSRARFEAGMQPGFDPNSIPGYAGALDTASKGLLARLSAQNGNPFGNPGGLIEANKAIVSGTAMPAINEYLRQNANVGFGNSMNAAIPLETGAVGQTGNIWNALGYGLNSITNPQPSLADMVKALQQGGLA